MRKFSTTEKGDVPTHIKLGRNRNINMKNQIKIQQELLPYELDSVAFWKFRTKSEVSDFLRNNAIEDRTDMKGDYPLEDTLWEAGDVYYAYYQDEDTHAIVVADQETEQNWAIEYDYDEETYYLSSEPAFWGNHWDSTIIYLTEAHSEEVA
jgi:hypothetical protein